MQWLNYVDLQLQGTYFFGEKISYVDFAFFMVLECVRLKQGKGKLEGVTVPAKLQLWFSVTMRKVTVVEELCASGVPLLPDQFL